MKKVASEPRRESALFLSHGWPETPVEPCALRDFLISAYALSARPRLTLALSSRWRAPSAVVGSDARPQLIRDFTHSDFRLESLDYSPGGAPELADRVRSLMISSGLACKLDPRRGLDCSIWGPMWLALPEESTRVCPMSLPEAVGAEGFFKAGRALRALRDEGVSVISCGQLLGRERSVNALISEPPEAGVLAILNECSAILSSSLSAANKVEPLKKALESAAALGAAEPAGYLPLFFHLGLAFDQEPSSLAHKSVAYGRMGNLCHWIGQNQ